MTKETHHIWVLISHQEVSAKLSSHSRTHALHSFTQSRTSLDPVKQITYKTPEALSLAAKDRS